MSNFVNPRHVQSLGHYGTGSLMSGAFSNPQIVTDRTTAAAAIKAESGVAHQKAEDKVVLRALDNPANFINGRNVLLDQYAEAATTFAMTAINQLGVAMGYADAGNAFNADGSILNDRALNGVAGNGTLGWDLVRKLSLSVYRELVAVADPMFEGSKDMMLKKLTHG